MPTTKINLPTQLDLEQFISIQAHDLRTPFNHIIGFSKMTLNNAGDAPLNDLQKEDLWTVYRSGMRALTMLNGLIDAARINRHEKELHCTENNIQQLVDQGFAQWKKFNPGAGVQTDCRVLTKTANLNADGILIRQVISSFIAYVAQFCDELKASVSVTVEEETNWFTFSFTSTGKKAQQTSPLDLELIGYVNRALIELHKGEIRKAEENDEGAVIQFTLPKARGTIL